MLGSLIEDAKTAVNGAAKTAGTGLVIGLLAAVASFFLTLAAFLWAEEQFGEVIAALGLGLFYLILTAAVFAVARFRREPRALRGRHALMLSQQHTPPSAIDSLAVAAAAQLMRVVGPKKLIPALALAVLVLGTLQPLPQAKSNGDKKPK